MFNKMVNKLLSDYHFDFNNPSYKKLETILSAQVRKVYKEFSDMCNLDKDKPIYSKSGILIANSFDRIVIGDYGPYIEFTKEQSNYKDYIVAPGEEYRLTPRYNKTIKYEWYTTKQNDCKLYWQLRGVVYADYKPKRYYISPFEVVQNKEVKENIMAKKRKVSIIIAGGRDFNDYELLKERVDFYLSEAVEKGFEIEIVSGTANGADKLGEKYAQERGYKVARFPANWDQFGKKAGYIRNADMAEYASDSKGALIAFWNGSRGTKHMIDLAKDRNLHVRIVNY